MAIQLTTPYNPGDSDPGASYAEVKIVAMLHELPERKFRLECEYGSTDTDGRWRPGRVRRDRFVIADRPADIDENEQPIAGTEDPQYTELVTSMPQEGETIYEAAARTLYQWLIDQGHYQGTIV